VVEKRLPDEEGSLQREKKEREGVASGAVLTAFFDRRQYKKTAPLRGRRVEGMKKGT